MFCVERWYCLNLFVNNFPQLSVDIDLSYLGLEPREEALHNVPSALSRITRNLNGSPGITATLQEEP